MYEVLPANFNTILPIWQNYLWPNRKSEIKDKSSLAFGGGYNMDIYNMGDSQFWACLHKKEIIGVNSGFWTSLGEYRSRGLYVDPAFRKRGIGKSLLKKTIDYAKQHAATTVWSIPRQSSLHIYRSVGFETYGEYFHENMEFGPNIFALLKL